VAYAKGKGERTYEVNHVKERGTRAGVGVFSQPAPDCHPPSFLHTFRKIRERRPGLSKSNTAED